MFLPTNITLKFGDSGDFVSELQRRLSVVQCFDEAGINGFFDGVTVNAVSQFQSMSGIQADGIAGPETLRRLNGAISGDYSGSSPDEAEAKRREEQAQALLQQQREQAYREEQALLVQQQQERAYQQQMQQQATAQPAATQQSYTPPQAIVPDQAQPQTHQQTYAPPQAYNVPPQQAPAAPAAPTAGDMLAQMLLATPTQQPAPQAQQQPQLQQAAALQAQAYQPQTAAAQAYVPPQPQTYVPPAQAAAAAATMAAQQATAPQGYTTPAAATPEAYSAPQQATAEQPRGMVGRAVQYANQVIQKLANYFEEKLPSHVINEVKEIGHTMAKAGMKEIPIAGAGQEQQRGVDAPGKSQSQGKQLG